MKSSALFIVSLIAQLITGCVVAAQPPIPVASQGETLIAATVGKLAIQAKITMREVQIGKSSDSRPAVIKTSCTYSKYPCTLVERLDIVVNGKSIFIPRSAFCDLADLTKAEIEADKMGPVLKLYGGDASESYIVKIEFDATHVKRRILSGAVAPDQPLQETTYHLRVLGD